MRTIIRASLIAIGISGTLATLTVLVLFVLQYAGVLCAVLVSIVGCWLFARLISYAGIDRTVNIR